MCVRLGQHPAFKDIVEKRMEPSDEELASDDKLDEYLLREVTTGQHISCTCKMGPDSDPMAVGRPVWPGARRGRVAGGRCLYHAQLRPGQYQRDHDDDRGTHSRFHQERLTTGRATNCQNPGPSRSLSFWIPGIRGLWKWMIGSRRSIFFAAC